MSKLYSQKRNILWNKGNWKHISKLHKKRTTFLFSSQRGNFLFIHVLHFPKIFWTTTKFNKINFRHPSLHNLFTQPTLPKYTLFLMLLPSLKQNCMKHIEPSLMIPIVSNNSLYSCLCLEKGIKILFLIH